MVSHLFYFLTVQIESGNIFIGVRYKDTPDSFGLVVGEFLLISNQ